MTEEMNPDKLLSELKHPFPEESFGVDLSRWNAKESKGIKLVSIKAQYIVERLNDVFGVYGWEFNTDFDKCSEGILCHGVLKVGKDPGVHRKVSSTGYSPTKKNLGDAYKSAQTDALGKAASWLCIGNDVFKGKVDADKIKGFKPSASLGVGNVSPKQKNLLAKFVNEKKLTKEEVLACKDAGGASKLIKKVLG